MTESNSPVSSATATAGATPELAELKQTCAGLESQMHNTRVVLLFVIGALCLFFWREGSFNGGLAAQLQPQAVQIGQYEAGLRQQKATIEDQFKALQNAVQRLIEYGKTHPDYLPILAKYGVVQAQPQGAQSAAPTAPPARK